MAKLNVAIADDNERILTMLDEVLTADDDILNAKLTVLPQYKVV